MTTPTLSSRIHGEINRAAAKKRMRSEAAKKAWRTRRRLARPTKVMRKWLEWLAARPANVIVQRREDCYGSMFSFGVYPETNPPSLYSPQFTRGTFWALQKRGWIERFARTKEQHVGTRWEGGKETKLYGYRAYWRITDKGRKALEAPSASP